MYIKDCPIPFHDLMEIVDFLLNLDIHRKFMFDGCQVDMLSYWLLFEWKIRDGSLVLTYRCHPKNIFSSTEPTNKKNNGG